MREEDVRVTFTDIWLDYKRYRKAYYYDQVMKTAKEQTIENEVKVDFENFTIRQEMMDKWKDREVEGQRQTYWYFFFSVSSLTLIYFLRVGVHEFRRWRYGYDDPLVKEESQTYDEVSAEHSMRRLKYQRKVKNWDQVPFVKS